MLLNIPRERLMRCSIPVLLSASAIVASNSSSKSKTSTSTANYIALTQRISITRCLPAFVSGDFLKFLGLKKPDCLCEIALEMDKEDTSSTQSQDFSSYKRLQNPPRFGEFHAIDGTLRAPNLIERYDVYALSDKNVSENKKLVMADIKLGTKVNGHPQIVHGGIVSLLFDDIMGFAYGVAINDFDEVAFTAYIKVDFRAPLPEDSNVLVEVSLEKLEGRKIYLKGTMKSVDGSILYSEAESLYVIARINV